MQNNTQFSSLTEMGCSPVLSEAAILNLKTEDLSALIDWISDHSEEEEKWKLWLEENKKNPPVTVNSNEAIQSIDHLINKAFADELQKNGHSKNASQKALLFTGNASVKAAENWIQEHKFDLDFEEEAMITGQEENQPKLTPQEAKLKLKELTEKARAIKKQREEEEAREREKNRVKSGKEMVETKRILEEQSARRQVELDRIQKAKDEAYKKELIEQMRRERAAKLGLKEETAVASSGPVAKKEVKYTKLEQLQIQCEQVKVGNHAYPQKAKTFFQTAQIYVNNIIKNNGEQKFRKINKQNKAFQSRVVEAFGGVETLEVIGYKEESGFLILKDFDLKELQGISAILQRYASYYN